jgi:hypothetical protein
MSKKLNRKIRENFPTSTLKELVEKGVLPPNYHLRDVEVVGGIIYQLENEN